MRRTTMVLAVAGAIAAAMAAVPALAPAHRSAAPHTCSGSAASPGVLSGNERSGVVVKGFCLVNSGTAHVFGTLTLRPGSALIAAYGLDRATGKPGSKLLVTGDVAVDRGGTLVMGCNTTSYPCLDDPSSGHPTLSSLDSVSGSVTSTAPLGVVIHSTKIGADVVQTGGGGGPGTFSCPTPTSGAFAFIKSPVYSDYEDSAVGGSMTVTKLTSCWLGVARVHVTGNLSLVSDKLGDPDAIEILSNHITGNLACRSDSPRTWDSNELNPQGSHNYPRKLDRNVVHGKRSGQCVKAGPLTAGGAPAGGPF